jgi:uncharacterized protein with NRDE domain
MCIVVFHWAPETDAPLSLAANRDEFFARPTAAMHWWPDSNVLAGRDLKNGGTWMGVSRTGRLALVTNVRDPSLRKSSAPSRGNIVSEFLESETDAQVFLQTLASRAPAYEGFNLVCGSLARSARELWFLNSIERTPRRLPHGTYALSNATLDTPWPKTQRIKAAFADIMKTKIGEEKLAALDALLIDTTHANDAALPNTGVPIEWERALSSIFIRHRDESGDIVYGTRSSSQLHVNFDGVYVHETTHLPESIGHARVREQFQFFFQH